MFFRKKQAHLLDPVVENLDSLKSLTVTLLPLYNWDTQEPQSFALSMTETMVTIISKVRLWNSHDFDQRMV